MSKKIIIGLFICFIGFVSIFVYFISSKSTNEELYLGEWDGVLYTSPENQLIINLIGISNQSIKELQKNILAINFKNTEQLEINSFDITTSNEKFKGKKIYTIAIDCNIKENTEEIINEVVIMYNNGNKKNYDIGELKIVSQNRDELLTQNGVHFLSFDSSDLFRNSIQNNSNFDLTLKDIQLENSNLKFKNIKVNGTPFNGNIKIQPKEVVNIEAEMSSKSTELLYIISPKYKYEMHNNEYSNYFDPSIVNVLELKEDQLNHMLTK